MSMCSREAGGPAPGRSPPGPGCSCLAASGCGSRTAPGRPPRRSRPRRHRGPFEKLSQYGLFEGDPAAQVPAEGVIPYDLNSALFSDYAEKYRFVKLPAGTHATYRDAEPSSSPSAR